MGTFRSTSGFRGADAGDSDPPPPYEEFDPTAHPSLDWTSASLGASSRPMEERPARSPVRNADEFFKSPRPPTIRQEPADPRVATQPSYLHPNDRAKRDSGSSGYSSDTSIFGSYPPIHSDYLTPPATPSKHNNSPVRPASPQGSYVRSRPKRCYGELIYAKNWTQDFSCSGCSMLQHVRANAKTLRVNHADSREVIHLNQCRVRRFHLPVVRGRGSNYEVERKSNLLCKVCYKLFRTVSTKYTADDLAEHLKVHDIKDLVRWLG